MAISTKQVGPNSASHGAEPLNDEPIVRSAADQAFIDKMVAKQRASKVMPRWTLEAAGDDWRLTPEMKDHELALAMSYDALGLTNRGELKSVFKTLVRQATTKGITDAKQFYSMLSYVCSIQPRDPLEAMLAVHMAIINEAFSDQLEDLTTAPNSMQFDSVSNALNKLTRTFTEQMSALKKHRSGGPQRIIVERLEVRDGGRAIVGAFGKDRDGGGITIDEGVDMTAPQNRRARAPRLTSARKEEKLQVPFPDQLGPTIDQKVAVELEVQVPPAPAEGRW